jgi:hypothetical protein
LEGKWYSIPEAPQLIFYSRILGDAVGVKVGERWRAIRKYFDPEFTPAICIKTIPIDSVLIFPFAGSVLVYGREQLLL